MQSAKSQSADCGEALTMNRRTAIRRLATFFLTTASLAQAQQAAKIPRIGYLSPNSGETPASEAFR